ncbi:MAG: sporulation protein YqfD [Desulfitobacterium hafniense]|nr:sporulation protein YqfD [Desulfitobacterium hafniense]
MFSKMEAFLNGRVYLLARGNQLPRFLNEGIKDGIEFFRTQKSELGLRAQVRLTDFIKLRRAARETHTKVKITAKYGWPFIAARWWRRKGLLIGIGIIVITISLLSQYILTVSVIGNKRIPQEQIIQSAEKLGLKTWVLHRNVDLNKIAKTLTEEFPNAAWIGIERKGTSVNIKVVEKTPPKVPNEYGNLVASKSGLVKEIMVIQGSPLIHEGETVKAGQVLIQAPSQAIAANPAGKANPSPSLGSNQQASGNTLSQKPVAKGFVRGRVWSSAEAKVSLVEDKVVESGRFAKGWGIKFGNRVIMVTTPDSPYPQSSKEVEVQSLPAWRNWRFPVELITVRYKELENVHIERTQAQARQLAEKMAREEVQSKVAPGVSMIEETVRVLPNTPNVERVRVEIETYEDLAVYP